MSSSTCRTSPSPPQPGEQAFQFWAATSAPSCTTASPRYRCLSAHTGLALLGWTLPPAAAIHYAARSSLSRCPECAVSPFLYSSRRSHFAFVFLTGSCDRRQLMPTKAPETKKSFSPRTRRLVSWQIFCAAEWKPAWHFCLKMLF